MVKAGGFKVTIIIALIIAAVYFSLGPIQTQTNLAGRRSRGIRSETRRRAGGNP